MRIRPMQWSLVACWCALVLGLLVVPVPNEYRAVWQARLQDFLHVPLFLVFVGGLIRFFAVPPARAFLAGLALAIGGELSQAAFGRSPAIADLFRGALGSAAAAMGFRATAPTARLQTPFMRLATGRAGRLLLSGALLALPLAEVVPALVDATIAWYRFPIVADFQTPFSAVRWHAGETRIERLYRADKRNWVGAMTFVPGPDASTDAILFPVVGNWARYHRFSLMIEVADTGPIEMAVSIRDGIKLPPTARRFETRHTIEPGRHELRIDLDALARGGEFAPVDLTRVQSVHLILLESHQPKTLQVHGIRLE